MPKNTTTITLSSLIVLIAVYSYFSPQITLWSINKAAQTNDVDALKSMVLYDSLKSSLSEDIRSQVVAAAMKEIKHNPSAGDEMAKANLLILPVIEAITMPANLTAMISDGKLKENIIPGKPPTENPTADKANALMSGRYEGYSRYHISTRPGSAKEEEALHFLLKRESILTWKLERIVLPEKLTDLYGAVRGKINAAKPSPVNAPAATALPHKDKSRQIEVEKYLFAKLVAKKNITRENDQQQVLIEIALENRSGKSVKNVESKLRINDADGDGVMNIAFSHNEEIAPGKSATYKGLVEVNKDVENDRYLWNTELNKLNTEFETSEITFGDGTRMETP